MSLQQIRSAARRLASLCLLTVVASCGGGGDNPGPTQPVPVPAATIALGAGTASITAGTTTTVTVTVARSGGFAGAVVVNATGLPAGVTTTGTTIDATATSGTLTLSAAATAPAATAVPVSIAATGTGVTITSVPLALTVVNPNGATVALSSSAGSIENGRSTTFTATVTRTGTFAGAVTITVPAASLPAGVTIPAQTVAANATTATFTVTSTIAAPVGVTALPVNATAVGATIAPLTYTLTITAGAISPVNTDITNPDGGFGSRLAMSADGSRVVVGATGPTNGTVRVYERTGTAWTQLGADIIGEATGDRAGSAVAINAAGTRIAIGAYLNDGGGGASGHVRVYDLVGGTWTQVGADLDGDATSWGFGWQVALSASGSRLVASGAGVNNTTGHVKVFDLVGGTWTQVGNTLTASNELGAGLDISDDGSTIAAGSPSAAGVSRIGTVVVYRLVGGTWTPLGNGLVGEQGGDTFGEWLSLSADGTRIAVGAPTDREGGVSGGGSPAGKVRVFSLSGATWAQLGNDILGTTGLNGDGLGTSVVLSADGTRLIATGPSQNVARVFTLGGTTWAQTGPDILGYGTAARSEGVAFSADGRTAALGYVNGTPRIVRVIRITP